MDTITNISQNLSNIFWDSKTDERFYIIKLKKFWFFSHDNFLFTLFKTFENYQPSINFENELYEIKISKQYALGTILKHFYGTISKNWLYY